MVGKGLSTHFHAVNCYVHVLIQKTYDQKVFRDTLLTFRQCPHIVAEQATTKGMEVGMPHDTIDLIGGTEFPSAGTKTPSSSYLVCMVASSRVYTEPNSTTIKTPTTFYLMSSGKLLGID